jgi:hypothetical protein
VTLRTRGLSRLKALDLESSKIIAAHLPRGITAAFRSFRPMPP